MKSSELRPRRTLNKQNGFNDGDIESEPFITGGAIGRKLPTTQKSQESSSSRTKRWILTIAVAVVSFVGIGLHSVPNDSNFFSGANTGCTLVPEDEAPLPVILMAEGRTGSSITWMTISRMTGFPNIAYEYTGQQAERTKAFFDSIDPEVGSHFAVQNICRLQHEGKNNVTRGEGVVGFQWKPIRYGLEHEYGIGALDEIAAQNDPGIRVIHLTRSPLDRLISNLKHAQSNGAIKAHCATGDEDCLKEHHQHEIAIQLPTGKELMRSLNQGLTHDRQVADILATRGIRHVHVDYDRLYHLNRADEWLRIFKFLGRGPQENLTMEEVRSNFDLAPTTASQHKDMIANFDEVWTTLKGTSLECLVH